MAKLKKLRSIKWAGIEFQPDFKRPVRAVRLGAVLVEVTGNSLGILVIGRIPLLESKPEEFRGVGDITMNLAANWIDYMFKDIREIGDENIFEQLAERWKWNLYMIQPLSIRAADLQGTLEKIGQRVYEKFVGEPFKEKPAIREPRTRVPVTLPPAWQLEELKKLTLGRSAFG
jgi:hypothetical protein